MPALDELPLPVLLLLAPPDPLDVGSARCRLTSRFFTTKHLSPDDWVRVHTPAEEVLYCRAWPSLLACKEWTYCQADTLVSGRHIDTDDGPTSSVPRRQCRVEKVTKPYVQAARVRVSVAKTAAGHIDETFAIPTFRAAEGQAIRVAARASLVGLLVSRGFTVGRQSGLEIKILDVHPPCLEALITKATRFDLESDKASSSQVPGRSSESLADLTEHMAGLDLASATNLHASPPAADSLLDLTARLGDLKIGSVANVRPEEPASETLPGLEVAYRGLMDIITYPLLYPEMIQTLGIEPPKGVLLHGPPGVGKTYLVSSVARACGARMVTINGPEVLGAYQGESEERLREKFREAQGPSSSSSPCILFIDEMDALTPRRESARTHESRVVAQLLTLMDGMSGRGSLIIVGATNKPNAIDAALRRPGRFDREVAIDVPSESARLAILASCCKSVPLADDVDLPALAAATNGYVGADLAALSREAALIAVRGGRTTRASGAIQPALSEVTHACLLAALAHHGGPSTQRGASVAVERLTWDDVGGLEGVKKRLRQAVEWPLLHKVTFQRLGLRPPRGVLLYGPPGCSKTTLVKIIAATSGATFLSLNGASLYSPYVGDSEQAIRATFQRARSGAPSVVFFDEIDAIVGKRGLGSGGSGSGKGDSVQERVLSALLNEMDGVETAKDILVVGATNRPDLIDAALLRPGRFDKVIYVPPPDDAARLQILKMYTRALPLGPDVDLAKIASPAVTGPRFTGADLKAVCREAAMEALREGRGVPSVVVSLRQFEAALAGIKPTLSDEMLEQYRSFSKVFGKGVDDVQI
ncbi:hypothetical protein HDU86_002000 [Geranomyces michiganensis]|nr:hypothetical protein HDU86_002000 [Geranomyces michiganensis]